LALVTVVILAFFVKEKGGKGLTQS